MNKLSKETLSALNVAFSVLEEEVNDAQAYYDDKSEKWQDSEKGTAYSAWIDELTNLMDSLQSCPEAPE